MTAPNRATQLDRLRKVVAAIPKHLSNVHEIILAGVSFTPASLVQFFLDQIKLLDDATNALANLHAAVKAIKSNKVTKGPTLRAFDAFVLSMFLSEPATLAEFGRSAPKVPVKGVGTKALAVEKLRATRTARNTMGKKARLKVKGQVDPAVVAALTSPQPPPAAGPSPKGSSPPHV
jgi:hypothetical protein